MDVTYDDETRTYTITGMPASVAHVLIWGGTQSDIVLAEEKLRMALVKAEDEQMPGATYAELFG